MLKWTNSKVTKPRQDFLVLAIIRLIYFPLDTIITVLLIIFFLRKPISNGRLCFFMIVFVKWRFCELLCNLVASDCVHRLHRKGEGGGEGGGGERGLSLENGPGPRPALPWPSNCARILMTCVYSMWAQMADRFRGLLCFPFHCFLLVSRQLIFIS